MADELTRELPQSVQGGVSSIPRATISPAPPGTPNIDTKESSTRELHRVRQTAFPTGPGAQPPMVASRGNLNREQENFRPFDGQDIGGGTGGGGSNVPLDGPTEGVGNKPISGITGTVGDERYEEARQKLVQNLAQPTLAPGAEQTFTPITEGPGEAIDPTKFQLGEQPVVQAASAAAQGYEAAQAAAAAAVDPVSYQAAQAAAAQASSAIKGEVDRLVTGTEVTSVQAEAAIEDLDKLDPRTTVNAVTKDLPNEATVKGQMDQLLAGLESGDIPAWAQPAVAAAESAMSARGISSSSVGRNALFNSIISAALPIAQQDATAKLSVFQQNLTNEQQAELANSQFFQTLTVKNLDNRQQAAIVNATNAQNAEIASAQNLTQASIENAKNFLSMDLANLSNEQQTLLTNAQFRQQTMLSNQAAENTAKQFNAANAQQAAQFNASLKAQIDQFNTTQVNSARQFSAAAQNQANIVNAQLKQDADKFNAQLSFQRDSFNTQNALAIEQSNVGWRRQMNQINTAGQNAVNQANAMNKFNLSNQALSFLWQEQRDNAKWANDNAQNEEERKVRMAIAALSNESMQDAATLSNIKTLASAAISIFDNWG